jgi:CspA family cold shock protein
MEERIRGEVKWFNNERGYGFIIKESDVGMENPTEYFVHYSSIQMDKYKTLKAGQIVNFVINQTEKGIQASEVEILV